MIYGLSCLVSVAYGNTPIRGGSELAVPYGSGFWPESGNSPPCGVCPLPAFTPLLPLRSLRLPVDITCPAELLSTPLFKCRKRGMQGRCATLAVRSSINESPESFEIFAPSRLAFKAGMGSWDFVLSP